MAQELYSEIGSMTPDNLFAGVNVNAIVKGITLKAGQGVLARGSVIGIITATGLGVLVDSTAEDGSKTAKYILADETDTGEAGATENVTVEVYQSGLFNRKALTFGGTDTAADHEDTLRQYGIFLKDNISY